MNLVCQVEGTASPARHFDFALAVRLQMPVGVRIFWVGEHFRRRQRRGTEASMGMLVGRSSVNWTAKNVSVIFFHNHLGPCWISAD